VIGGDDDAGIQAIPCAEGQWRDREICGISCAGPQPVGPLAIERRLATMDRMACTISERAHFNESDNDVTPEPLDEMSLPTVVCLQSVVAAH
jgi:hypothetical protein